MSSYTTATLSELEDLCDSDNFRIVDVKEGYIRDTDSESSCDRSRDGRGYCESYDGERCRSRGRCRPQNCDAGLSVFASVITPLCEIDPKSSRCSGCVEFLMRRKNKTITFQWEPFSAVMAASGVTHISVSQSICNLPSYPLTFPIMIHYKSQRRMTYMEINPHRDRSQIRIYLHANGSADNVHAGDAIFIPGSTVTWIID